MTKSEKGILLSTTSFRTLVITREFGRVGRLRERELAGFGKCSAWGHLGRLQSLCSDQPLQPLRRGQSLQPLRRGQSLQSLHGLQSMRR